MTWALATIAVLLIGTRPSRAGWKGSTSPGAMFFTTAGLLAGPVLGLLDLASTASR